MLRMPTAAWTIEDWNVIPEGLRGRILHLIHEDDLPNIPVGTELVSVIGDRCVLGCEPMTLDARDGYLAWGFLDDA